MPRKSTRLRLGERDYDILDHVLRYRMTTREVLHRLFFEDSAPNAATKVASRLVDHDFLTRHTLYEPRTYFTLGPQATSLFGLSAKKNAALGPQSLREQFSMLNFCCLSAHLRERLRVSEVPQEYIVKRIDSSSYYYDDDGETTRLGYMRIDGGGPAAHVLRKCRKDIRLREHHPPLRALIEKGEFLIAIITAHEEKKDMIAHAICRESWPVKFRIEVVADLAHLLTRSRPTR